MYQIRWDRVCFLVLMLGFGFVPLCPAQGGQEWRHVFNPYTGQWAALAPPTPAPSPRPPEPAPLVPAALQILHYEPTAASKWVYEQPACPSRYYHKPLQGRDVCATPFGAEVAARCPAGTQLVTDYHVAGSDACRSARVFRGAVRAPGCLLRAVAVRQA